jgi:chromosome segregation ATPase
MSMGIVGKQSEIDWPVLASRCELAIQNVTDLCNESESRHLVEEEKTKQFLALKERVARNEKRAEDTDRLLKAVEETLTEVREQSHSTKETLELFQSEAERDRELRVQRESMAEQRFMSLVASAQQNHVELLKEFGEAIKEINSAGMEHVSLNARIDGIERKIVEGNKTIPQITRVLMLTTIGLMTSIVGLVWLLWGPIMSVIHPYIDAIIAAGKIKP